MAINSPPSISLRPRQEQMVTLALKALETRQNTLCVAPTGAGKTIMLSALIGRFLQKGKKALVLQHRQELIYQNSVSFRKVVKGVSTSLVTAEKKNFDGTVVFAMVPTLARSRREWPPFDLVVVDEAHHSVAKTWEGIIRRAQTKNPNVKVVGFTATPNRGDRQGLSKIFDHVADQISLSELVLDGNLVYPRTLAIELDENAQEQLKALYWTQRGNKKKSVNEAKMLKQAGHILNKDFYNQEVFRHWQENAATRRTVIFCTNVLHAQGIEQTFQSQGIQTGHVNGALSSKDRTKTLRKFQRGDLQVLTNVAVLTEGWDCPEVSCVILLRPSSYKSTMIQMVGRGLRPSTDKKDCLILDFGLSSRVHGSLEQEVQLFIKEKAQKLKPCPRCSAKIPQNASRCPECGLELREQGLETDAPAFYRHLTLKEIQLLEMSQFRWIYYKEQRSFVAHTFKGCFIITQTGDELFQGFLFPRDELLQPFCRGPKEWCFMQGEKALKTLDPHYKAHYSWEDQPPHA